MWFLITWAKLASYKNIDRKSEKMTNFCFVLLKRFMIIYLPLTEKFHIKTIIIIPVSVFLELFLNFESFLWTLKAYSQPFSASTFYNLNLCVSVEKFIHCLFIVQLSRKSQEICRLWHIHVYVKMQVDFRFLPLAFDIWG